MAAPMQHSAGAAVTTSPHPTAAATTQGASGLVSSQELDPVSMIKALVPRLKETLAKLMRVAGQEFHHHAQSDSCIKPSEQSVQGLEKCLEEFYSLCNQIELNLKLALDCHTLHVDNLRNAPNPVQLPTQSTRPDQPPQEGMPYTQYLTIANAQVACAKAVHDTLMEFSRRLLERTGGMVQPSQGLT